ncbi:sugar ABC transporter ATP-binding protein [Parafrankia elaeagni]|uniref:sugar ABC transporter ATP-binding protein n=1 Tax=Parafrankia elaeagni TaxID=222534 RepID=UPI0003A7760B|nr:sugar ABC transporter ATP-binding protein [Parafrankia elaeagni]
MTDAVVVSKLVKTFGRSQALRGVDLRIEAGSVHALVGENGAGKSTALGVIAGRVSKSSGDVSVFGHELRGGHPRFARAAGVFAIYQELTIIPALTVEANLFLGHPLARFGLLSEREMRVRYLELCGRVGVAAQPPHTLARSLSVAEQQMIEILRALVTEARIILFDEPTASLASSEREALFSTIRRLRADGVTVVLVSHNLDEVLAISDHITVFRDGAVVADGPRVEFTKASIIDAMLGKQVDPRLAAEFSNESTGVPKEATRRRSHRSDGRRTTLAVSGLTVPGVVSGIEFEVLPGEILGLGGLVGSGRSTVLRALAGVEPRARGRMWIDGEEIPWPHTVRRALRHGIALLPEDRKTQGLVLAMPAMDNIALSNFRGARRWGMVSPRSVETATREHGQAFGLSSTRLRDPATHLSGGNQQKLLLARWRYVQPRLLLADEPTRGIDVGAKSEILQSLEDMAAGGLSVVMVSSELEEIAAAADRVVVLREGTQVGILDAVTAPISPQGILTLAFGSDNPNDQPAQVQRHESQLEEKIS